MLLLPQLVLVYHLVALALITNGVARHSVETLVDGGVRNPVRHVNSSLRLVLVVLAGFFSELVLGPHIFELVRAVSVSWSSDTGRE